MSWSSNAFSDSCQEAIPFRKRPQAREDESQNQDLTDWSGATNLDSAAGCLRILDKI